MKKNKNEKALSRHELLYHNTEKLLKKYRDVVWSVEASTLQAKINFELEFECGIDEFLEMSYAAGADLSGTDLEQHMRTIERSRKMLKIIENAVDILRRKHKHGEIYYWILYYTYLSEQEPLNADAILDQLCETLAPVTMSWKTYYRKRKEAIDCLSTILWGYTSNDCANIVNEFFGEGDKTNEKKNQ